MSDIFIDAEGHVIKNSMVDEHSIIKITEKVPDAKNIGKIICGETNSNILTFEMNRFYDNVDMVSKNIKFIIKTPSFGFDDYASNVQHNANLIRFSWVVPYSATQEAGNVNVAIEFFDDSYSLKTMPFIIKVDKSINSEETQLEVPANWYISIESRILQLENKANENIADAVEDYMNEHPVQAVSDEHITEIVDDYMSKNSSTFVTDEHITEVAVASFGSDEFNTAVDTQVNAYLPKYFEENPIEGSVDEVISTETVQSNNVLELSDVAETTKNGMTMSVVDEVITLNGTTTSTTDFIFTSNYLEDGVYTFAFEILEGSCNGALKYGYQSEVFVELLESGKNATISSHNRSKVRIASGVTCDNFKIHLWAISGDEYKAWEPYGEYTTKTLKEDIKSKKIDNAVNQSNQALEQSNIAKSSIDNFVATSDYYLGVWGNCYVKKNGETVSDNGFQTDKLKLKQGMKLALNASGGSNVVTISRWDSTYTVMHSAICISSDKTQQIWEYSATDKEEYIAICGRLGTSYKYEYSVSYEPIQTIHNDLISHIENVQYLNNFSAYFLSGMNGIAIGDSLTYGVVDGTTGSAKNTDKNYPYWLAKMLNCTIENDGHAGIDSLGYYEFHASSKEYSSYDFALIFLGTNYGLEDTVSDGANTTTQTGCYMQLIEKIRSNNADCKIILIKPFITVGDGNVKTVNTKADTKKAIDDITEKYGLISIDLDIEPFNTTYPDGAVHQFDKTHLGVGGYLLMANKIAIGIGQALLSNIGFMNDTY